MKIDKSTINILKNFSRIQDGLFIEANKNYLTTTNENQSILANAPIKESFPFDFTITNIGDFLNIVSLFNEPDFEFNENYVTISEDGRNCKYYSGKKNRVSVPKYPLLPIKEFVVCFGVSDSILSKCMKASNVMELEDFAFSSKNNQISLVVSDSEANSTKNIYNEVLEDLYDGSEFEASILTDSMIMIKDDYDVGLFKNGNTKLAVFTGKTSTGNSFSFENAGKEFGSDKIRYWIALRPKSEI